MGCEVLLAMASLPIYLSTQQVDERAPGAHRYSVRRVLTLSTIVVILVIWLLKLLVFAVSYQYLAQSSTVDVSQLKAHAPVSYLTLHALESEAAASVPPPTVISASNQSSDALRIEGKAWPSTIVTVFVSRVKSNDHAEAVKMFTTTSDAAGTWLIAEENASYALPAGSYVVSAYTVDEQRSAKSYPSASVPLQVRATIAEQVVSHVDFISNLAMIFFVISGVLLTMFII